MNSYQSIYHMETGDESQLILAADQRKVTKVEAGFRHEGQLNGKTTLVFCMYYSTATNGQYEGYEFFEGLFEGKEASLWFFHKGTFDEKVVQARVESLPESGTGSLVGRKLGFSVVFEGHGPYELDIEVL